MEHQEDELAEFIVKQISKHRRRSDIVFDVSEMTGMDYREAQKLVYQVAYEQRKSIAARQSPILVFFGVVFIVGGILLLVYALIPPLVALSNGEAYIPAVSSIYLIGFGITLIVGGIAGLWQTIRGFFD